ncbi:hypothetical protein NDU88_011116 [Pleurodeles waltl]|uniref:Uncharacterized protein n=1 Tax=Pleurodeles waltl TaxID=8319 RepID=A0AAV7S577_PLEWA|nr:hypothetical protein NDU88_011116 [Pleurodeles waltl]
MVFPDYSKEVQSRRNTFLALKRKLRQVGMTYAMIFPARLRVISQGITLFFNTLQEVWSWIETQPVQDSWEVQAWQSLRTKRTKWKKRGPLGSPSPWPRRRSRPCAGRLKILVFGKGGLASPTSRGGSPIEREKNNGAALSNITTPSDPSDLSDSELEHPIVTPRTADDLL